MSNIEQRKDEHLDIVLRGAASATNRSNGLEAIRFAHCALPDIDLTMVDLSTPFLGRILAAPIVISSMTGGPARSHAMNRHIAEACEAAGLAFGVGSQRIALEGESLTGFGKDLRRLAPSVPILANFGAAQLKQWDGVAMARRAVEMIEADALIIHLNPLQEAVQPGGDTDWSGLLEQIEEVCRRSEFPVICKEVGAGISGRVARQLVDAGVSVIDVAGLGGTSWVAVEAERAASEDQRAIAQPFRDWGIPTARAIVDVRQSCPDVALVASGGIRDGLDCAKAIRLGADLVGLAAGILESALADTRSLVAQLEVFTAQLRIACFCTASRDLAHLRTAALIDPPGYLEQRDTTNRSES